MTTLSPELIEKVKAAQTPEELLALAKENGWEMTEESAQAYFAQLNKSGELSDDELDNVSGGGCRKDDGRLVVTVGHICSHWICHKCWVNDNAARSRNDMDVHTCPDVYGGSKVLACCDTCHHCSYEQGLWLCNFKGYC